MNTFYIILLTLVIYSSISTITYMITKENEEVLCAFGLGIVGLSLSGILRVVERIVSIFRYHIGKRSIFEEKATGDRYKCKTNDADDIWHWTEGYKLIKRYAKKNEWKDIPDFSKEFIEHSKINCDNCMYDDECCCDWPYDEVRCKHDQWGKVIEFDEFKKK